MQRSVGRLSKKSRQLGRKVRGWRATVAELVKTISIGARVQFVPYAKFEDFPHPRYTGRVGKVVKKQGSAYVVDFYDGGKKKRLITRPVHLKVM
jgi:large subunit ribosomal protein L21e